MIVGDLRLQETVGDWENVGDWETVADCGRLGDCGRLLRLWERLQELAGDCKRQFEMVGGRGTSHIVGFIYDDRALHCYHSPIVRFIIMLHNELVTNKNNILSN